MSAADCVDVVVKVLEALRGSWQNEAELQELAFNSMLGELPWSEAVLLPSVYREVVLGEAGRIDLVASFPFIHVGIEVKVDGSGEVLRQLHRYANSNEIDGLVLLTSKLGRHRYPMSEINGKPFRIVRAPRFL